ETRALRGDPRTIGRGARGRRRRPGFHRRARRSGLRRAARRGSAHLSSTQGRADRDRRGRARTAVGLGCPPPKRGLAGLGRSPRRGLAPSLRGGAAPPATGRNRRAAGPAHGGDGRTRPIRRRPREWADRQTREV
ncbi:MAG: hypothetical protein AVDCRST_MAG08-2258, partial [uncultured Acetobacteraceae bacterium]